MNHREAEVDRVLRAGLKLPRAGQAFDARVRARIVAQGSVFSAPPVREPGLLEILIGWLNPLALGLFAGVTTAVVTVWLLHYSAVWSAVLPWMSLAVTSVAIVFCFWPHWLGLRR
jgi:hypothetical protein